MIWLQVLQVFFWENFGPSDGKTYLRSDCLHKLFLVRLGVCVGLNYVCLIPSKQKDENLPILNLLLFLVSYDVSMHLKFWAGNPNIFIDYMLM